MREIKFKYIFETDIGFITKIYSLDSIEIGLEKICDSHLYPLIARLPYTGLKDKNGDEIYEGDVVGKDFNTPQWREFVCEFKDGCFVFQDLHHSTVCNRASSYYSHMIEIKGNIYESPELLKNNQ